MVGLSVFNAIHLSPSPFLSLSLSLSSLSLSLFLFLSLFGCVSASPFSNIILLFTVCALYPTKAHVAERLQQADANFPRIFRHCTWVLNGTHTPVVLYKSRGERYKDYYPFKTKKPSLNTQVCIICIAMYSLKQQWSSSKWHMGICLRLFPRW